MTRREVRPLPQLRNPALRCRPGGNTCRALAALVGGKVSAYTRRLTSAVAAASCMLARVTTSKHSRPLLQQHRGPGYPSRWQLARDVSIFQLKLFLDGLKDIALAPLSLIAALLGIIGMSRQSRRALYLVMRMGKGFDDWVDLYGQLDPDRQLGEGGRAGKLDHYVDLAEKAVIDARARSKASAEGEKQ